MSQELERVYTINLGKVLLTPNNQRSKRAINMIKEGMDIDLIVKLSELSEEEILVLKAEIEGEMGQSSNPRLAFTPQSLPEVRSRKASLPVPAWGCTPAWN